MKYFFSMLENLDKKKKKRNLSIIRKFTFVPSLVNKDNFSNLHLFWKPTKLQGLITNVVGIGEVGFKLENIPGSPQCCTNRNVQDSKN